MKFKSDFITNSSSSSFIAWGVSLDKINFPDEIALQIFKSHLKDEKESLARCDERWRTGYQETISEMESLETDKARIEYVDKKMDFEDKITLAMKGTERPFEWENTDYCEGIGISPSTLTSKYPDVRVGEIKKFVAEKFQEILKVDVKESDIKFFEESWYNG